MFSLSSRSIGTIVDFDPIDFISSSSSSRAPIVLPTKINSAPSKANDLAIDLPSPREAPVTSATLFFILLFISNYCLRYPTTTTVVLEDFHPYNL